MATSTIAAEARHFTGWSIVVSLLMILAGVLAIGLPVAAGIAVNIVVAWLLVFAGVAHLVFGWHLRAMGGIIPKNLRAASLICTWSPSRAAAQSAPYLAQFRTMRAWPAICRSNGCCRRKFLQGLPPRIEAARARKDGCDGIRRASII